MTSLYLWRDEIWLLNKELLHYFDMRLINQNYILKASNPTSCYWTRRFPKTPLHIQLLQRVIGSFLLSFYLRLRSQHHFILAILFLYP